MEKRQKTWADIDIERRFGITADGETVRCIMCGYNLPISLEKHHPEVGNPEAIYLCRNCHHIVTYWTYQRDSFVDYYLMLGKEASEFVKYLLLTYKNKVEQMVSLRKLSKPNMGILWILNASAEDLNFCAENNVARFGIVSILRNNSGGNKWGMMKFGDVVSAMNYKGFTASQADHALRWLCERNIVQKPTYGYWALVEGISFGKFFQASQT